MAQYVPISVRIIRQETAKAYQVLLTNNTFEWIPKGQVDDPSAYNAGDENLTMRVSAWLADQKGIGT